MSELPATTPIDKVQRAISELGQHQTLFTEETFGVILMALNERLRRLRTTTEIPTPTSDEIRLVTVIFIDVKDSTSLARQMDTGDFKTVLEDAHRRIASVIAQWDGMVGQYLGDGVLAFFGAQKSRGDDAVRCVSAALSINTVMESYANEVFLMHGVEFAVRMGISTGKLVVGMIGTADKQELLALGPATNLAARLQNEAPSGGIFIDSATYNRVRGQFDIRSRPMARIKGFEEPVSMYEVIGRSERVGQELTLTKVGGLTVPIIGRDDLMAEIRTELHEILNGGRLRAITLLGELGMGKSRILQELIQQTSENYLLILGIAHYENRAIAHNILADFLAKYCHLTDDMPAEIAKTQIVNTITMAWDDPSAKQVAEVIGYLAGYGFEDSPFVRSLFASKDKTQAMTFRWVARFLRGLARQYNQPLLFIVDNLQWADAESITLINYLTRELQDLNGLLVVGARPIALDTYPTYLQDFAPHKRLWLEKFDETTTHHLISQIIAPVERVPKTMIDTIVQRAEGNPLFVMEFLGMLFDSNVFQRTSEGKWRFNIILYDTAFKNLPAGLIEVVQSRLDDLSNESRHTLQLASITGLTFWSGTVSEMLGKETEVILDQLSKRGMIIRNNESTFEGDSQYTFRHSLYRDVAYDMLPRAKREQYHRQVANWLISRIANKPDYFPMLADQFEAAGEHEAALFTYLEAAQNRTQRGMLNEVLVLVERALAMTRNLPRDVAIGVVVQLWTLQAQALSGLGRYSESSAAAQSALRLFSEMPPSQLLSIRVNAGRLLGTAHTNLGNYDLASDTLSSTYDWLDELDNVQMASVLRAFGLLNLYRGRLTDALAYQQRALTYARTSAQDREIASTLAQLGAITLERGDLATALGYFETCLDMNHQSGFMNYESADLRSIGTVYMALQTYERAYATFDMANLLRDQLGEGDMLLMGWSALCDLYRGHTVQGMSELKRLVTAPHRDVYSQQQVRLMLLDGLILCEEYQSAVAESQAFIKEIATVNHVFHARATLRLGRAKHFLNDRDAAMFISMGLDWEQAYGGRELWLANYWLAETATKAQAKQYYERAAHLLQNIGNSLYAKADLQYAFLHGEVVKKIFKLAGVRL